MFNINTKNIKKGRKFYFLFSIVGVFFFIILLTLAFGGQFKKMAMDSEVIADSIDENCHNDSDSGYLCSPVFHYTVNNNKYSCHILGSSSFQLSPNHKNVYYETKNPANCVTDYSVKTPLILKLSILLPIIFIYVGVKGLVKISDRLKKIKKLTQNGKLIKGLPYTMESTGMEMGGRAIMAPTVKYTLANGTILNLRGDPRFDHKQIDTDGLVDLVIDENDLNNYYIDFDINSA